MKIVKIESKGVFVCPAPNNQFFVKVVVEVTRKKWLRNVFVNTEHEMFYERIRENVLRESSGGTYWSYDFRSREAAEKAASLIREHNIPYEMSIHFGFITHSFSSRDLFENRIDGAKT